ncbi:MAG: cation diffusion facilitator CzcD-associated flavoprotein CzcO [Acidimicrobiales bacterium]|jgi:cation diffusion facilitator CzcD-associated flavoprotein CzcO
MQNFDAVIIGAGVSGMYQLHKLRQLGLSVQVLEAGTEVGGTWYWNRYPGARFDSESYTYGYSWSEEVLQEWDWKERFSPQPENLKYLQFVADKFDFRRDIRFETRVERAQFDNEAAKWVVTTEDGYEVTSTFLITAIGALSIPVMPRYEGIADFTGASFHTSDWPKEPVDFTGKRVAVIGTGATAVQLIPEVAKTAGDLTVFQRTPNWCAPLHNGPIEAAEMADIKSRYTEIFETCNSTFAGFQHVPDHRKALETSAEDRHELWEQLWDEPGFGIWMANFRDVLVNEEANALLTEFVASKIRERISDPALAEKLIPKTHGFGTRRVPMETNYFEVYNQPNVELVDIVETPIDRVTAEGIRTTEIDGSQQERPFDYIIYATGFDAVTGSFDKIDIRGVDDVALRDVWASGPRTFLGLQINGFPNLFTLVGPNNASTFCNMPRCIEQNVEWVTEFIGYLRANNYSRAEPTVEAMDQWGDHVITTGDRMLFSKVNSWFMGVNSNIDGRQERRFLLYAAGLPTYRQKADEAAQGAYSDFVLR